MFLRKSKSSTRHYESILPLGLTLIIIMMIITSLVAATQIKESSDTMIESLKQHTLHNKLLSTMAHAATSRSAILVEMIQIDDPFRLDDLASELNVHFVDFINARKSLTKQKIDPQMQILLDKQAEISRVNGYLQLEVYELLEQEKKQQAIDLFTNVTLPEQQKMLATLREMAEYQFNAEQITYQKLKTNNRKVITPLFILDLLTVLISIFLSLYILRRLKARDKKLLKMANTDLLTNLPNRFNFISNINDFIEQQPDSTFAIVFFDIDHFKSINDNYGHEIGDEILKRFSEKIRSSVDEVDILSRFGGDEFVLLLRCIDSEQQAIEFISMLSTELETSFFINNNEIFISTSIGASFYPKDGKKTNTLLAHADVAMYSAKQMGRNCIQFFSKEISEKMEKDHFIYHSLHKVLKNENVDNELFLKYQLLHNIKNGDVSECEALLRWKNMDGDFILADDFIPLAEKTNLIEKVNLFVINEACKQQHEWQQSGINNIRININLSGNKIIFNNLLNQFRSNLVTMNLDPALFGIELTERTIHEISQDTIYQLDEIRKQGMKISIDDFGTGYSSLSYLKKLPITTLKIDKEFITGLPNNKDDVALVKAIITLGHSLNLDVVAEGVETIEQFEFLKEHACNIAQGYYFYRPLNCKQISLLNQVA